MNRLLSTMVLVEGITHIEDLSIGEFIRTVETIKDKIVTEKLDGSNLWFGVDDIGLYTSREGKSPKKGRFYNVSQYGLSSNYNGFRGAHLALENIESTIRKHLEEGDVVEIEVLFGRQPNTVTYGVEGKNFIVILRGVGGTPQERVDALANALKGKKTTVESTVVSSPDGENIETNDERLVWEFTNVVPLKSNKIDTTEAMKLLAGLKKFASSKNKVLPEKTNQEVIEVSLTSIPKDKREEVKQERERLTQEILEKFKAPIKELLLKKLVRKTKPFLQDKKLHPSEDIGVEGVVVRDPVTGSQTKIVDKDVFTAINTFNSSVRAQIAGLVRTTDKDAPIETRGGAFGEAKIEIANLMGAKELAMSSGVKRFLSKFKKDDPITTAQEVAQSLNISNVTATRSKISNILERTIQQVDGILQQFKRDAGEYKLQLKTGKEIGISPEIMKRTLTAFAETKKDIRDIRNNVMSAKTGADLVMAVYGKTVESLFDGVSESVKESKCLSLLQIIEQDGGDAGASTSGAAPVTGDSGGIGSTYTQHDAVQKTTAGNIAPYAFKLFKNKVVLKRKRNFTRPPKIKAPKLGVPESAMTFSLIRAIHEDWSHVKDMKFATDVTNSATSARDVEFAQLRNTVQLDKNISQTDVSRYLDKAHELNDEVESIVFGLELDNGSIVKVYVSANDANAFEATLGEMLGQYSDIEEVLNIAADRFDIVDVEWPDNFGADNPTQNNEYSAETDDSEIDRDVFDNDSFLDDEDIDDTSDADDDNVERDEEDQDDDANDQDSQEGDQEEDDGEYEEDDGEYEEDDQDSQDEEDDEERDDQDDDEEEEEEEEEDGDEENDDEDEDEDDEDEERDDFGQPIKKKKPQTTEESFIKLGVMLNEAAALSEQVPQAFTNKALQSVNELLKLIGIDTTNNRSFVYQARQLQAKNSLPVRVSRNPVVLNALRVAINKLSSVIEVARSRMPQQQQQQQTESTKFSLLSSVIAESVTKWNIADMKNVGFAISTNGMIIEMNADEAEKLHVAISRGKQVSVATQKGERFMFTPNTTRGYNIKKVGSADSKHMSDADIDNLLDKLAAK